MKKKYGLLALTGVLTLAACTQGNGPTPVAKQPLTINVTGASTATVTVKNAAGTSVFSGAVTGSTVQQVDPGTYTVSGAAVTGFNPVADQTTTISDAGKTVTLAYTPTGTTPPPAGLTPAKVELVTIKDDANQVLVSRKEVNENKNATLFVAQSEETVCIAAKVTDAAGLPVPNAPVTITPTGVAIDTITVRAGCDSNINTQALVASEGTTNSDGIVYFRVYSTYGYNPASGIRESALLTSEPFVKFLIEPKNTAIPAANLLEVKGWFLNMSHLYWTAEGRNPIRTPTRIGSDVGSITNIFNPRLTEGQTNDAFFQTGVYTKQPQSSSLFGPQAFGGYVRYDLQSGDVGKVRFVLTGGEDTISADGKTYIDNAPATGVQLTPVVNSPADLPINVKIKSTYVSQILFGNTTYEFPLKDYTFTKIYDSGFLSIKKSVNNHVLTWQGEPVTLSATNVDTLNKEPFITTYTIETKNESKTASVFNSSIADQVPAELGVDITTIKAYKVNADGSETALPGTGTYDVAKHAITWNYSQFSQLSEIKPGEIYRFRFNVYARQKPGYQWTSPDGAGYTIKPTLQTPYSDPYLVTDGREVNDTTVEYFLSNTDFSKPIVTDYDPTADESDINVVRPLFDITKTRLSNFAIDQGGTGIFNINVKQIDRVNRALAGYAPDAGYAVLFNKYPGEFDGGTKSAAGAPNPQQLSHQNPYGKNLTLRDTFSQELDFTDALPITIKNSGPLPTEFAATGAVRPDSVTVNTPAPGTNSAAQSIIWNPIKLFGRFDDANTTVRLTLSQVNPLDNLYVNCAYFDGDNLNQPSEQFVGTATSPAYASTWYAINKLIANPESINDNMNYQGGELWEEEVAGIGTAQRGFITRPGFVPAVQLGIQSCDTLTARIPGPPILSLTTKGEYTDNNSTLIDANKKDIYRAGVGVGDANFFYKVDIENGGTQATGLTYTFDLSNVGVRFPAAGSFKLYRSNDGIAWSDTGLVPVVVVAGKTLRFDNVTVPTGGFVRAVLEADPSSVPAGGKVDLTSSFNYPAGAGSPQSGQVVEQTTLTNP
jgi:hypothetical protein